MFQTTIRREGWYYLLILILVFGGAIFKEVNLLLILAGMMLGPVLLNWQAVSANLRGLRIERRLPRGLSAGDLLSVTLVLANTRRRLGAWAVVVEEQLERLTNDPSLRAREAPRRLEVFFPYAAGGQSVKAEYRGQLLERGRYQFGPIRVSTRFPFGLFSRTFLREEKETLIVLPRLGRLAEGWTARQMETVTGGERRRQRPGSDGDFYGVREWRPGDGRRLVHWRSSARSGKLVVRELERPRNRDIALVMDLWQPAAATEEQRDSVELAVSFAATVLSDLCRKGGSSVWLAYEERGTCRAEVGEPVCLGGPASAALWQGLMEQLAIVEPSRNESLPAVLAHALRQIDFGTDVLVVSTRPIDLTDRNRFAVLWSDPTLRDRIRHLRSIDTSSAQLRTFFQFATNH
jgi:uncharacterized protein (DUF58 family)